MTLNLWRRYADLTECMHGISLEELIMAVRRQSQGFSRGTSTFRGVTHHPSGDACIGPLGPVPLQAFYCGAGKYNSAEAGIELT